MIPLIVVDSATLQLPIPYVCSITLGHVTSCDIVDPSPGIIISKCWLDTKEISCGVAMIE